MDYLWSQIRRVEDEEECGTRFIQADIPFMILGMPVYRDYIIIHSDEADEEDGSGHMTFKYGYSETK